jgi:hypothetical protein
MALRRLSNKPLAALCDIEAGKTCSLFFDKVIFPASQFALTPGGSNRYFGDTELKDWMWFVMHKEAEDDISLNNPTNPRLIELVRNQSRLRNIDVVPICRTSEPLGLDTPPIENHAYQAVITNFPIVDEAKLSWKQVLEARNDPSLARSFVDLRLWVGSVPTGSTPEMLTDVLSVRMERYKSSLRRHGIESINGVLRSVIDPTKIATLSGVAVGMFQVGGPDLAVLSTLILAGADFSVKVSDYLLGKSKIRCDFAEAAILYELAKRVDA